MFTEGNRSYYTHDDNEGLTNSDDYDEEIKLLMAYENYALEKKDFLKEINQLKISLAKKDTIINTVTHQLIEKEKHNEVLECEVVSLRKELENTNTLNLRFGKGSENLDQIIKVQHLPIIKTGLGFHEGVSSSQDDVRKSNAKSEILNKELKGFFHQQPRK